MFDFLLVVIVSFAAGVVSSRFVKERLKSLQAKVNSLLKR